MCKTRVDVARFDPRPNIAIPIAARSCVRAPMGTLQRLIEFACRRPGAAAGRFDPSVRPATSFSDLDVRPPITDGSPDVIET